MSESQSRAATHSIASELTAFQQDLLTILSEEPMYGLAVKRELEEHYDKEVNHGQLYPNLDDLVEMGLVEKSQLDKRTNQYSLTDDGETAITNQLEWVLSKFVTNDDRADTVRDRIDAHLWHRPYRDRVGEQRIRVGYNFDDIKITILVDFDW